MSFFSLLSVAVAAVGAMEVDLVPVEESQNNRCAEYGCIYHEWRLDAVEGVRLVISGYEDGVDATLYEVSTDGKYEILLDVYPIIRDKQGKHWWGSPRNLRSIPVVAEEGSLTVYATLDHDQCDDGVHNRPKWQGAIPAVLFLGEKKGWNVEQPSYEFKLIPIRDLIAQARERGKGNESGDRFQCPLHQRESAGTNG